MLLRVPRFGILVLTGSSITDPHRHRQQHYKPAAALQNGTSFTKRHQLYKTAPALQNGTSITKRHQLYKPAAA